MIEIRKTEIFSRWLKGLKDAIAKAHIDRRIERLKNGNSGDVEPIGEGCSEMRIHYGPGYRVYYKDTGKEIIILLCGGDKSMQATDIAKAKKIAREVEYDSEDE
ncbi:MAG: type II toxin-antitoxin system RelE/ParE family toxin [Acidobacteriota bacterium]|jgi:putative addiction module killer protein|nr:type II toxin-antitoxin system RelE/ParE family toxin [Acidobacteriota bacterium]